MTTDDASLQFVCPQCIAMLKAPMALAGSRCRCPRCQFVFQAPRESWRPFAGETYAIQEDGTQPSAAPAVEIAVTCSLCNARMYATLDQVGQTVTCPDCGRPVVVPRPLTPPKPAVPSVIIEPYALHGEPSQTAEDDNESLIRVFCPRCGTMMYATEDQTGRSLICPDCHTSVIVPQPGPHRKRIDAMAEAGGGYNIAGQNQAASSAPTPPPVITPPNAPPPRVQAVRVRAQRKFEPYFRHPLLPRAPFLNDTFTFPFRPDAGGHVALTGFWIVATLWLGFQSVQLIHDFDARAIFLGAMLCALTLISTLFLFAFVTSAALAVVRDTADGCGRVQNWPGMAFIDWFGDSLHIFNSLCASVAPGVGVGWLLTQYDQPADAAIAASLFFLFPFVLLSTLETNSPLGLFSWPVCRTLWQAPLGWIAFLLSAAGLLGAAGMILVQASLMRWEVRVVVTGLTLTAVWFIYFRLLGRLALYCTDRGRKRAEALEAADTPDADG